MVNTEGLRFGLVYDIGDNHVRYSGKGGLRFLQISNLCVEKVKILKQLSTCFHFSCITLFLDHFFASDSQLKIKICMLSMYLGVKIKDLKKRELFHHY